jgi:hypothetical protein
MKAQANPIRGAFWHWSALLAASYFGVFLIGVAAGAVLG